MVTQPVNPGDQEAKWERGREHLGIFCLNRCCKPWREKPDMGQMAAKALATLPCLWLVVMAKLASRGDDCCPSSLQILLPALDDYLGPAAIHARGFWTLWL